jgi:U3 small nucleolar RNA-associated protein MPP10
MPEIQTKITDSLQNAKNEFDTLEDLIQTNKEKSEKFKTTCKHVYDYIRRIDDNLNDNVLPELIINDVDHEQIYQQLQLHNNNDFNNLMKYFSKCLVNIDKISFNIDTTEKNSKIKNGISNNLNEQEDTEESEDIDESEDENDFNNENGDLFSDEELNKLDKKKKGNSEFGIPDGSDSEISDFEVEQDGDDDNDDKEENNEDAEDSDEVDEDLEDLYGDLGDEKDVMELNKKIRDYRDTDDEEVSEEEREESINNNDEIKHSKKETKRQSNNLFKDDNEIEDDDNQKSSFEKRQEKLKKQMEQIHDSMLDNLNNKPWQLKGEANAKSRPQDSLLEDYLEFDHTTRVAPQPSIDSTIKLEDMLKQRIKDKTFDDVERKIKPVEMNYEYKKQVVLDHDKSKQSLSQIYEQEYLNKKEQELNSVSVNESKEKSNPKHDEIKTLLQSLFIKLDALSNFHYTPRAVSLYIPK